MEKIIQQLETMRRRYNKLTMDSGSHGDYLDRGRPDEKQKEMALKRLEELEKKIESQKKQLHRKIRKTQREASKALEAWKTIHIYTISMIIEEEERENKARNTRLFVARELLEKWKNFPEVNIVIPLENHYFLKDYGKRYTQCKKKLLSGSSSLENRDSLNYS